MIRIITHLEAMILLGVLEDNHKILCEEGYEYEANETLGALEILRGLTQKEVEEVVE